MKIERRLATHPIATYELCTVDPEGGVFVLHVLVLVSLIIIFTLPRQKYEIPYEVL